LYCSAFVLALLDDVSIRLLGGSVPLLLTPLGCCLIFD